MGIAPLPEEPIPDETGYSPLAQKKPRESEGYEAFEEELEGDEGPYGSLVMLRPKTFKKKPVLTVDPDELEKAYQAFDLCGAQIMEGGDVAAPRPGTNFLGLAPIEDGEEAIESDDDVVADDDLDALLQDALHAEDEVEAVETPGDATSFATSELPPEFPVTPVEPTFDTGATEPPAGPELPAAGPEAHYDAPIQAEPEAQQPAPPEEAEPARPSFSLPEFSSEPEQDHDETPHGDGWRLVPPEQEPSDQLPPEPFSADPEPALDAPASYDEPSAADSYGHDGFAEEPTYEEPAHDEPVPQGSSYGTTTYYEDEEEVFDPFAAPAAPRLAQVQETGTRSQLRARLLREEQQAAEEKRASGFSLFGWLRRLFG